MLAIGMKKSLVIAATVIIFIAAGVTAFLVVKNINDSAAEDPEIAARAEREAAEQAAAAELRRNDTTVRNYLARITGQIYFYQANHRGSIPVSDEDITAFSEEYLSDTELTHPISNTQLSLSLEEKGTDVVLYQPGHICSSQMETTESESPRDFALSITLPSGEMYCTGS